MKELSDIDVVKIVGANGKRHANDFYPTPTECTIALLRTGLIPYGAKVWEPACGEGHIVMVMEKHGRPCHGTDIQTGTDFLTAEFPLGADWIVTNPPFSLADQFIEKAASFCVPFALLLKAHYWNSKKRKCLFDNFTPNYIFPLTWRPDFTGKGGAMIDMCWNVWLGTQDHRCIYIPLEKPKEEQPIANENHA